MFDCSTMSLSTWENCIWSFLHFDNGATSNFADVLLEHGGLPHVLPLAVHLNFFGWTSRGDHSDVLTIWVLLWDPSFML